MTTKFDCQVVNGLSNAVCGRVDLLEKMLGLKVRENLRYSDIQKIVKSGFAEEFFDLGDEIMTTCTATDGTEYDFPWLVVDFRDVEWEDGTVHPGMVLQAKYATAEQVPFDAGEGIVVDPETEQTAQEGWYYFGQKTYGNLVYYTKLDLNIGDSIPFNDYITVCKCGLFNDQNIVAGGWHNYKMSAVRQWLNSDADANEWWSPTHLGDVAPDELNTLKGFLSGLPVDFISVLKPTRIKAITDNGVDIMYDNMFLPSIIEMYGSRENAEGSYFQYWKEKTGLGHPDSSANEGRIITVINGVSDMPLAWSRSAEINGSNNSLENTIELETGRLDNYGSSNYALHVLPCCIIS